MDINSKIQTTELQIVALGKAFSELAGKLERIKTQAAKPASPVRRDLKTKRLQEIENFYTKRKLNKSHV